VKTASRYRYNLFSGPGQHELMSASSETHLRLVGRI
jgi:hypothetical protein